MANTGTFERSFHLIGVGYSIEKKNGTHEDFKYNYDGRRAFLQLDAPRAARAMRDWIEANPRIWPDLGLDRAVMLTLYLELRWRNPKRVIIKRIKYTGFMLGFDPYRKK